VVERFVLAGPASEELAKSLSSKLNLEVMKSSFKIFPDGESKFTSQDNVSGKSVVIVQSLYPPVDQHLFQLLLASHKLSQEGAKVTAVVPYLAYARQDKEFLPGEGVTLGVVAHLMRSAGIRRLVTVDIHSVEGFALFSFPIYSVSAVPTLAAYAKEKLPLENAVVISPDFGASKRTEAFAALYGARYLQLSKARDRKTGEVKVREQAVDVKDKNVVILDDIISTGGTVKVAAETVLAQGATNAVAICTHGLFVDDAFQKLEKARIEKIIGTNTVPSRFGLVDISDALASHLKTLDE
jgi:ribose-phosphate pyrophosphokinase